MKVITVYSNGKVKMGNPSRRRRKCASQILKTNYNDATGEIYDTYCIEDYYTKKIEYYIEVYNPENNDVFIINPCQFGMNNNLRSCRYIINKLTKDAECKEFIKLLKNLK